MAEFNYFVYEKKGELGIGKVFESPTFKKIDLDPEQAYDVVKIDNKANYPGLFPKDNCDERKFMAPLRKVMCRIDTCDFCECMKTPDEINQEFTNMDYRLGYFYCNECKDILMECLKNSGSEPVWYIREQIEKKQSDNSVWIERSRRDDSGKIVNHGPYVFEKWQITGWYAEMILDKTDNILKPHLICEGKGYSKSVPVEKILKLNPKDNPDYNPNDDPIYK